MALTMADWSAVQQQAAINKQTVISTHDEQFFNLVKSKLAERYFPTKFVEMESYGKIKETTAA